MKAKIKATGEYIEVEQRGSTFLSVNDGSLYNVNELDLNIIDNMMSEQEKWYWKDKHIQAAIAAMQGVLANPDTILNRESIVEAAIKIADALIAELKKGGVE